MSSTELFRNYLDIINENSQPKIQLDEGVMDVLSAAVPKLIKLLGGSNATALAQEVNKITGGDLTPNSENAVKVATALGLDKMLNTQSNQQTSAQPAAQLSEGGDWKQTLVNALTASVIIPLKLVGAGSKVIMYVGLAVLLLAGRILGKKTNIGF